MVVRDCQNYEKSTWVSFHARDSIGSDTFSEGIVPFFNHKIFPDSGPHKENVYHQEFDTLLLPSTDGTVAI